MQKRIVKKVVISLIVISLIALGGGIFFAYHKSQKTAEKNNSQPPNQPSHNSPKKVLANQIKADLQKDLEKVKKDTSHHLTYINRPWGGCGVPSGEEGWIVLVSPNIPENKGKSDSIAPGELEKEDYEEIVSLIKQVNTTREKVIEQRKQEQENRENQKLSSNPKMFLYKGLDDWVDYEGRYIFVGYENGQRFNLVFPENHPAMANFPHSPKQNDYYLIEGVENVPFQPKKFGWYFAYKDVKLNDKITITSC